MWANLLQSSSKPSTARSWPLRPAAARRSAGGRYLESACACVGLLVPAQVPAPGINSADAAHSCSDFRRFEYNYHHPKRLWGTSSSRTRPTDLKTLLQHGCITAGPLQLLCFGQMYAYSIKPWRMVHHSKQSYPWTALDLHRLPQWQRLAKAPANWKLKSRCTCIRSCCDCYYHEDTPYSLLN